MCAIQFLLTKFSTDGISTRIGITKLAITFAVSRVYRLSGELDIQGYTGLGMVQHARFSDKKIQPKIEVEQIFCYNIKKFILGENYLCTQKLVFTLQPQNEHETYALFRSLLCESDQTILYEILLEANLRRASALLVNPNVSMAKILQDMFAETHEKYMKSKKQLQELEEKYRKLQDSWD